MYKKQEILKLSDFVLSERQKHSISESIGNAVKFTKAVMHHTKFIKMEFNKDMFDDISGGIFTGLRLEFHSTVGMMVVDTDNHHFHIPVGSTIEDVLHFHSSPKLVLNERGISFYDTLDLDSRTIIT